MCSAPLQVMLHPVKSSIRILVEYFTLWQMTKQTEETVVKTVGLML